MDRPDLKANIEQGMQRCIESFAEALATGDFEDALLEASGAQGGYLYLADQARAEQRNSSGGCER
jgi:hypothetical protein